MLGLEDRKRTGRWATALGASCVAVLKLWGIMVRLVRFWSAYYCYDDCCRSDARGSSDGVEKATSVCFRRQRGEDDGTTACDVANRSRFRHCRPVGLVGG